MNLHQDRSKTNILKNKLKDLIDKEEEIDSLFVQWKFEAIRAGLPSLEYLENKTNEKIQELCQGK